jgi:hypothetical protein
MNDLRALTSLASISTFQHEPRARVADQGAGQGPPQARRAVRGAIVVPVSSDQRIKETH